MIRTSNKWLTDASGAVRLGRPGSVRRRCCWRHSVAKLPRVVSPGNFGQSRQSDLGLFGDLQGVIYLDSEVAHGGFLRLRLRLRRGGCGHDKLVAFSCKRRGFCPSCGARRMAQTAAHLVDHVIPHVPVRQRWSCLGGFAACSAAV